MSTTAAISHYNLQNYRKGIILMAKDRMLLLPYGIYFRKHSCLVQAINREINKYTSSGLISAWTADLTHEKLIKEYIHNEQLQLQAPQKLSMKQIQGVFIICMVMYLISGGILVIELLADKCKFIRVVVEFCTFKK